MTNKAACFSSEETLYETPNSIFQPFDNKYHFTLDVCALDSNTKVLKHFTPEDDGLSRSWQGEICFMNPPYGDPEYPCKPKCKKKICIKRGHHNHKYVPGLRDWVKKAHEEWNKGDCTILGLLPARTDTIWFHNYVKPYKKFDFFKGRIKFLLHGVQNKNGAAFPSMWNIWEKIPRWKLMLKRVSGSWNPDGGFKGR